MAELDTSGGGHKKKGPGVKKGKKLSTRVDLTPMVDLGFLLITFFIFTTTMSQPTAMKLTMPDDRLDNPDQQTKISEDGALTILIGDKDHIWYYEGQLATDGSNFKSANFNGENSIRDVITKRKAFVISRNSGTKEPDKDFVVVIKPSKNCKYKNIIDILDEMSINLVKRYALVDITDVEENLVKLSDNQ
jgi:biopolymer transport protein ExbD